VTAATIVQVCRTNDIPDGSAKAFDVDGRSIAIFRVGNEFFAYRNICPHLYAPICYAAVSGTMVPSAPGEYVYGLEDQVVRCPWHNWEFDLRTGHSLFTGDRRRLGPVRLVENDGWLSVEVKGHGQRVAETDEGD
jgi:nitrite reductase (NADH) small subunit